jgi:hypothetical protein
VEHDIWVRIVPNEITGATSAERLIRGRWPRRTTEVRCSVALHDPREEAALATRRAVSAKGEPEAMFRAP